MVKCRFGIDRLAAEEQASLEALALVCDDADVRTAPA
jgi:hypothetical protein